jgi:hypothetical protein
MRNVLILLLTVMMIFFLSCASEDAGGDEMSEESTESEPCMSVASEDILSEAQKPLNEAAKAAIAVHYGISDLSKLTLIEIREPTSSSKNKETCYVYELSELFGYRTYVDLKIYFDETGQLARSPSNYGDDIVYFLDILTKEMLDEAAAALEKQIGEPFDRPNFMLDDEGYLCMQVEIIEHYETPDKNGEDHKHHFYKERIIKKT